MQFDPAVVVAFAVPIEFRETGDVTVRLTMLVGGGAAAMGAAVDAIVDDEATAGAIVDDGVLKATVGTGAPAATGCVEPGEAVAQLAISNPTNPNDAR